MPLTPLASQFIIFLRSSWLVFFVFTWSCIILTSKNWFPNFCIKFIITHTWATRASKQGIFVFFFKIVSFDFLENCLKGELLWYFTSHTWIYPKIRFQNSWKYDISRMGWAVMLVFCIWIDSHRSIKLIELGLQCLGMPKVLQKLNQ